MTTRRASARWLSSLLDHCRSTQTDNSRRPLQLSLADQSRDFWPHALMERSSPNPASCSRLDDRLRPTLYLVSAGPKPEDSIDLPVRQAVAGLTASPAVPRRPGG